MSRFFFVIFTVALLCVLPVISFAVASDVPDFPLYVSESGEITVPYDRDATKETTAFFANFADSPHLIVQTKVRMSSSVPGEDYVIRDALAFVKIPSSSSGNLFFMYDSNAAKYDSHVSVGLKAGTQLFFEYLEYTYNPVSNSLSYTALRSSDSIDFNFVVNSSTLSGKVTHYPRYNTIAGGIQFRSILQSNGQTYSDPLYDWWVGQDGGGAVPPDPDGSLNEDTDGDGEPDINIDTDGDKRPDINIDTDGDKTPDINVDTDGDKRPDINVDTDGDRIPDINIDTDGDKTPDINVDTNGDKKPDINVDTNGDGKPDINVDTNGDGKPDINVDTDGDKKPDINVDTDGDKTPDINVDINGDKKPDINVDTNGDGRPDINVDTDGDGSADTDIDTDGDGIPDDNISGGGSGGGSTPGGGSPDIGDGSDFDPDDSYVPHYNEWNLFDPYDYEDSYDNPFADDLPYNPLDGWDIPQKMPTIPTTPDFGSYKFHDPFHVPGWAK